MKNMILGTGSFEPFFTTRHPEIPASVETPPSPIPLVAPFLATTWVPQATVLNITNIVTSIKPRVAPIARPPRIDGTSSEQENTHVRIIDRQSSLKPPELTVQPYWVSSPSSARMILGLISSSISQFTGGGSEETGSDGSLFHQLPQFLRLLQGR